LRFWIENFRSDDEVAAGVASAGDQDTAIGQRDSGVTCAQQDEDIQRLDQLGTRGALTHVAIASMTTAPSRAKKWPSMLLALGAVCISSVLS
jgi:hypothetical protein